jgi:nucleoside-diphosphate-sugar epimerase
MMTDSPGDHCPIDKEPLSEEGALLKVWRGSADKIVITGAGGFVGKRLVRSLVDAGKKVRVLVRSNRDDEFFRGLGVEIYSGDIRDENIPEWLLDGAESVINLAAVVSKKGVDEQEFWDVHVESTRRLLDAAVKLKLRRFVHCSTIGVLGHIAHPPADETTPYNATDIYQVTKAESEKVALDYHGREGLEVTIVRPAAVYGPGDMRMLKLFKHIATGAFKMIGDGKTLIHPVYVDDLVDGIILATFELNAAGRTYILGGEQYLTLNQWAAIIAAAAGVPLSRIKIPYRPLWLVSCLCEILCGTIGVEPPLFRRRVDFFVKNRAFSIARAKTELGYGPKVGLVEGAVRTLVWYREEGLL